MDIVCFRYILLLDLSPDEAVPVVAPVCANVPGHDADEEVLEVDCEAVEAVVRPLRDCVAKDEDAETYRQDEVPLHRALEYE